MKKALAFLALALCAGCAATPASKYANATGKLADDVHSAHQQVNNVVATASGEAQGRLQAASDDLTDAETQIPVLQNEVKDYSNLQTENSNLKADFWSYRQHKLFTLIVAIVVAGGLAILLMYILSNMSGPIGIVATIGFHVVTLGVGFFISAIKKQMSNIKLPASLAAAAKA